MIKKLFFASCLAFSFVALAQEQDSVLIKKELQEVKVNALRATNLTPISFTNISKEELEEQKFGGADACDSSMAPQPAYTGDPSVAEIGCAAAAGEQPRALIGNHNGGVHQ